MTRSPHLVDLLHAYCMPPGIRSSLLIWIAGGPRPAWDLAERQAQKALEELLSRHARDTREPAAKPSA